MFCNTVQALPECEGEDDTQWTNCQGTYLKKEVGSSWTRDFTGEFGSVPGKRHGKGSSHIYKDGSFISTYVGEWKDDKPHGQGTVSRANGNKYVGEFKDGKRHGQGTYTYANGDKYVGEYKDNEQHGQGTYTDATDGTKYVGEFKNDKAHGKGTYTDPADGTKYVGEFKDGERHGKGTYTAKNGKVSKMENGKIIKQGVLGKLGRWL